MYKDHTLHPHMYPHMHACIHISKLASRGFILVHNDQIYQSLLTLQLAFNVNHNDITTSNNVRNRNKAINTILES